MGCIGQPCRNPRTLFSKEPALTLAVFAGASQLAAVQLMAKHASLAVVILAGLVINLRMFMYSASIAPHFKGLGPAKKGLAAYLLTDQAYALPETFSRMLRFIPASVLPALVAPAVLLHGGTGLAA